MSNQASVDEDANDADVFHPVCHQRFKTGPPSDLIWDAVWCVCTCFRSFPFCGLCGAAPTHTHIFVFPPILSSKLMSRFVFRRCFIAHKPVVVPAGELSLRFYEDGRRLTNLRSVRLTQHFHSRPHICLLGSSGSGVDGDTSAELHRLNAGWIWRPLSSSLETLLISH